MIAMLELIKSENLIGDIMAQKPVWMMVGEGVGQIFRSAGKKYDEAQKAQEMAKKKAQAQAEPKKPAMQKVQSAEEAAKLLRKNRGGKLP